MPSVENVVLRPKQQRFVDEFLVDLNASQAAQRAGYSKRTAGAIGSENLRKPKIQNAIQRAMDQRSKRIRVDQDRVVRELAIIGFSDVKTLFEFGLNGIQIGDLGEESRAISAFEEKPSGGVRIAVHDKMKALALLARHLHAPNATRSTIDLVAPVPMTQQLLDGLDPDQQMI